MQRLILLALLPLYPLVTLIVLVRYVWSILFSPSRAWRIAVSTDQHLNCAANGSEDETISSRAARSSQKGERWACVLCKLLDKVQRDHCKNSLGT